MGMSRREKEELRVVQKALLRKKHDEFLDAYINYSESGDKVSKKVLERKALDLSIIDPNFTFFIDKTHGHGREREHG